MAKSGTASDPVESLLIDVRASTQGFAQDVATMRGNLDGTLVAGFDSAGKVLENSLVSAVKKGSASFLDLRGVALGVLSDIAGQAVSGLFSGLLGIGGGGSGGGGIGSLLGALAGLPGRATGGPVSPGAAYVVGERGPELFVPTSAGSIAANTGSAARDVRVSITVNAPAGGDPAQALQRSSRQVASAVRRALAQA